MRRYRQRLKDNSAKYGEMKNKTQGQKTERKIEKEKRISSDKYKANILLYHAVLRSAGKYHKFGSAILNYLK